MDSRTGKDVSRHPRAVEIARGVYWIGALDPGLRTFDIILDTAQGTTYNSYLVRGRDGVAVIDTVKDGFGAEFFARLESVADYSEIRAIVLNHLEPDHSGALPELKRRAPQADIYISSRATAIFKALAKTDEDLRQAPRVAVRTGDRLSLGERTLQFLQTPHLHWPDTQCTYLLDEAVLFSGDLFGSHVCDGRLFDDQVGASREAFDYYYAHIMRPFRRHLLTALELLQPLRIDLIAPAHGPVLRDRPARYLDRYRELATRGQPACSDEGLPSLVILYVSAYGNTARMAESIRVGALQEAAGMRVSVHDLAHEEPALLVDRIEAADAIAIGSPTINADAVKPVWELLASLAVIDLTGKVGAAFGSFGWSGEAVRLIEERLRQLRMRVPVPGVRIKLTPGAEDLEGCERFGRRLAAALTGNEEGDRVIELAELG